MVGGGWAGGRGGNPAKFLVHQFRAKTSILLPCYNWKTKMAETKTPTSETFHFNHFIQFIHF